MDNTEHKGIRLVVEDEKSLYSAFSPEDEFDEPVKAYIRSKMTDGGYRQRADMTVMAQRPIDEERFRSAVSNWIKEERASFRKREKDTLIRLIGSLIFGSLLIVMSIIGEKQYDVIKYSLMPIMGSLALGEAGSILITDVPVIRIERWFFKEIEKNSVIRFEYAHEKKSGADYLRRDRPLF